ncbi:MAG: lipoprotein-releasing ABC transporter permease subunit [Deltaproteobacteria bacterium]|nr:lipoprotein-releasing ABC transporter permease subunit [Candidatus Zymogenaceae bacterium]
MNYELLIGLRYLKAKRKQTFISIISVISVGGVALGVAALIVVISVMSGFKEDLQRKILGAYPHLIVEYDREAMDAGGQPAYPELIALIEEVPGAVAASPYVKGQIMLTGEFGGASGAVIRGIDVETAHEVLGLSEYVSPEDLARLPEGEEELPGIIMGEGLARNMAVIEGDEVLMLSPEGAISPLGLVPLTMRFRVVKLFNAGLYEFDATSAFIALESAQEFFNMGEEVTGVEVKVENVYRVDRVTAVLEEELDRGFVIKDWREMNQNLFAALKLEKLAMFIILVMIVFVATCNIVSTLIMMVMEKNRDIAILKSMGANDRSIMKIFMYEGCIIGIFGTILGLITGLLICGALKRFEFIKLDPSQFYMTTLPVKIDVSDICIITIASCILCFVATLYPAWRASRLDPVEAIRYE